RLHGSHKSLFPMVMLQSCLTAKLLRARSLGHIQVLSCAHPLTLVALAGNSNKRRKEVRILQEMQLLQVAAMNYRLRPLEKFVTYFPRMEQLSDKESYKLSCQLEPESQ
ncbi:ral-GDS-related protein-like, partial [Theropithecus gelada]|uniref:ral-GDS-related protein-like n=1 Tax=Theropithecus gelada TaxID=9565 RepID=UPI000DC19648